VTTLSTTPGRRTTGPQSIASAATEFAYRPDVDGLRAVAVLAVLAFHGFPRVVPGGFVGVDVFFVISGFLISGIILDALKRGTFSFADFYARRIRRIFPALALVLVATVVLGWWTLIPADYRQLGAHVAAGAGFVSNVLLWRDAGYFDAAAESKPLLHLWSLGVEEQYYLVWPLLLFVLRRHIHRVLPMVAAFAVASFALNVFLVQRDPTATFYLPQTRFWELMLGGMLAYVRVFGPTDGGRRARPLLRAVRAALARAPVRNALATAGALLVATALLVLDESSAFPGSWALLPTVGTTLLIAAGPDAWLNRRVLAHRGFVYIGLISYPLYLWHWPLLTYARLYIGAEPPVLVRCAALAASVLLAWLTYELLEKRIRRARSTRARRRTVAALATSLSALAIYGLLASSYYTRSRSAAVPGLVAVSEAFDDWAYEGDHDIPGDTPRTVLFIGDSHMQQYLPRIQKIAHEHAAPARTVMAKTAGGCAPFPDIERRGRRCAAFVEQALALARGPQVEIVVFGASWAGFVQRTDYRKVGDLDGAPLELEGADADWVLGRFEAELSDLVRRGKRVVIILSSPRGADFDPRKWVQRAGWFDFHVHIDRSAVPLSEAMATSNEIDARLEAIARRVGATVVEPVDSICTVHGCPTIDAAGNPLFKDDTHLRASFVRDRFDALDRFVYDDLHAQNRFEARSR